MSRHSTVESIITTGFTLVGSLLVLLLLVAGIAMNYQVQPESTRVSEALELTQAIKITEFCTRIRSYDTHLAAERARGVPYSRVIVQFVDTQSHAAGIAPQRAAEIARLLVDSIYINDDPMYAGSGAFWDACHRAAR